MPALRRSAAFAVTAVALTAGCGAAEPRRETLTVLAAASLTEVFTELAETFETQHPGVRVELSLAGSDALVAQAVQGAPADVLATASTATMRTAVEAGAVGTPLTFARNVLMIATPPDDPGRVTGLADLADPARTVVLCAPVVPCGAASALVFAHAGLTPAPDSLEQDVKAVLTKVELGEADAGLVYATDVQAADGAVRGIAVPDAPTTEYPIAVLADAPHRALADEFVALVRSDAGRTALADAGFELP